MDTNITRAVEWVRGWFERPRDDRPTDDEGGSRDPWARKPVPVRPRPNSRTSAAALAEPDDD
jgi:hypothetical protein